MQPSSMAVLPELWQLMDNRVLGSLVKPALVNTELRNYVVYVAAQCIHLILRKILFY
jgi:hypothetical protein